MSLPVVVPLVEVQRTHHTFLHAAQPRAALLKLTHARRLIKRDELDWLPQNTALITTSTVNDNSLAHIDWETELEIIQTLQPAYHIPTDYSLYDDMTLRERRTAIKNCMNGTRWIADQLTTTTPSTTLLPLLKGKTRNERTLCYDALDELNCDTAAFYATQYFTSGQGNNINALIERLTTIQHEQPTLSIFLIGLLAPSYLERLPSNVTAVSGQNQWRSRVTPTTMTNREIETTWQSLINTLTHALNTPR